MNTKSIEQKMKDPTRHNDAFDRWINEPMVRMGLSMIPAGEHQDALRMLLRSAFDSGVGAGAGEIVISMIENMMKREDSR